MGWSVIEELGIEYEPRHGDREVSRLQSPIYAAQAIDGSYLIVDELCSEKPIPFRMEYRTIRVDPRGNTVFDTSELGISDGYGCLVAGDSIAVLRRTTWELLLCSPGGNIDKRIDLTSLSKFMPRIVSWTDRDTFLIVFLDRSRRLDIVEIDRQGRLLWLLPRNRDVLGVPSSVQLLSTNTILVADAFCHAIWELDRQGEITWQFGNAGDPAKSPDRVSGATCARELTDGRRRLITDTRNHRLLVVDAEGKSIQVGPDTGQLCDPVYADFNRDGNLLVCDSGNARVVELDHQQQTVWQYGNPIRTRRHFCFPRSVEMTAAGQYLIADTANDRIVTAAAGCTPQEIKCGDVGLFWPRCVRSTPSGSLLIADGRGGRIVELGPNGQIMNELSEVKWNGVQPLEDPHDVRYLPNGNLLIADSPQDAVFEVDWSGNVRRAVGGDDTVNLSDPHSTQQLDDGRLLICDTGNHRILFVDSQGKCLDEVSTIDGGDFVLRLNLPKYSEVNPDGTLVIVDTGNNRVLAATMAGRLLWDITDLPDSQLPRLYQPRWAALLNRDEVVISDHFHHRIVHVRRNVDGDVNASI